VKRYTLKFQPISPSISATDLREEVDRVLLRLHPRITYKMGPLYRGVDGAMLANIAMDGKRQLLEEAFRSKVWSLPVRFEKLTWGWSTENEDALLLISANAPLEADPLAGVEPLDGSLEITMSKRRMQGRYIALMLSTLALLLMLFVNFRYPRSTVWEGIYIVFFALFMFTLNDTPIDVRVYVDKITIRSEELEVSFWMLKKPACLPWEQIWGVDYTNPLCTLLTKENKLRFLLSKRFGCEQKDEVLKTIVERAGLSYVEGNFQILSYRKPDA